MSRARLLGLAATAAATAALCAARPAAAHPLDLGYLRIEAAGDTVTAALDLDATAASHLLDLGGVALDTAALRLRTGDLADATVRSGALTSDLGPCRWKTAAASLRVRTASLTVTATCPSGFRTLRWAFPFVRDPRVAATFQLLVKAKLPAGSTVITLDRSAPELVLGEEAPVAAAASTGLGRTPLLLSLALALGAALGTALYRLRSARSSRSGRSARGSHA